MNQILMIITHMERKIPKKRQKAKIHKTNQMMHKKNKKQKYQNLIVWLRNIKMN